MGFIFLLYASISDSIEFLIAYIVVFSFSYIFFIKIAKSESFSMHLTARNIAELMRIRFFARLSAVDSSPELNFSHLLREYNFSDFSGSHAVHDFVRCSEPLCFDTNANFEASYQSVRERWLDGQRYYFTKKEKQLSAKSRRLKLLKKLLLPASVVQAIFLILFADGLENILLLGVPAKSMVLFLMGLFPLLFAVWDVYENKMATQELLWQYRNQRIFFEDALRQLDENDASEGRKKILELLVKRSISELFQWILNRYHREHEPSS
jgi:hypothetical protein